MTRQTDTMNRVKLLRAEACQISKSIKAARLLNAKEILEDLQEKHDKALAEATALEDSGQARLEQIDVYKVTKAKGKKSYDYWHASWKHGGKSHSVYLGSCGKMSQAEALQKARALKARDLGIDLRRNESVS